MNYGQHEGERKWRYTPGMGAEVELVWLYEMAHKMETIVEIGSYQGQSTHALLTGTKGMVYSVDPFMPYAEIPKYTQDVFHAFVHNVGSFENLRYLRLTSAQASRIFDDKSIDMVFIDGAHDYDNVKLDIECWLPKTKKIICGHDYYECDSKAVIYGIVKATKEKFGDKVKKGAGSLWYVEL